MNYPEVHSLEESLAILDKYKEQLAQEQYERIKSTISGHAIENLYANERDVIALVEMEVKNLSGDEIIQELKNRGDL